MNRVAIVAGARTPFVKAGKAFAKLGPLALAKHGVQGLLERHDVDPGGLDAIAFGVVVPEPGKPNLAREIVLETGLPRGIEAQTIVRKRLRHRAIDFQLVIRREDAGFHLVRRKSVALLQVARISDHLIDCAHLAPAVRVGVAEEAI